MPKYISEDVPQSIINVFNTVDWKKVDGKKESELAEMLWKVVDNQIILFKPNLAKKANFEKYLNMK